MRMGTTQKSLYIMRAEPWTSQPQTGTATSMACWLAWLWRLALTGSTTSPRHTSTALSSQVSLGGGTVSGAGGQTPSCSIPGEPGWLGGVLLQGGAGSCILVFLSGSDSQVGSESHTCGLSVQWGKFPIWLPQTYILTHPLYLPPFLSPHPFLPRLTPQYIHRTCLLCLCPCSPLVPMLSLIQPCPAPLPAAFELLPSQQHLCIPA